MAREHLVHERAHLILLPDVAGDCLAAPAVRPREGLLERFGAASAHHHAGAQCRQLERRRAAEARPSAAHERDLPVEQTGLEELRGHGRASVSGRRRI